MRLITPRNAGPASVNKYLLPHEEQVITVRKHPAVLIGPIALALGAILIAIVLGTTVLMHTKNAALVLIIACLIFLAYLGYRTWEWSEEYFVVTSERMLQATGVFTRKIAMMPLVKVTDMSFQRSSLGRVLGYGSFILESAGQDQALRTITHVPYPEQLYLEICGLLFPSEIPCPRCDGQGLITERNEDGEETMYVCPLCGGKKKISVGRSVSERDDTLVFPNNRDPGDD
ncbi:MAG TPA: PH domain-containing protein [Streptosporangiaceae bacterium]|nr:PH domain-containing protein [Streptosporangiaceae bacterium]